MKLLKVFFGFLLLSNHLCNPSWAGKWYAGPGGSNLNDGKSEALPFSLSFAFSSLSPILPGDTLMLLDGIYEGNFTLEKSGIASKPIYILPKNIGKAVIDPGKNRTAEAGILVNSSNVWLIDLHISSSSLEKREDLGNTVPYESGITVFGNNVKLINCWVYDIPGGGLQLWRPGFNLEVYGCVIFNNGSQALTRGTGHGMYVQHDDADYPKIVRNNIVFNNASQGINFYTTNPQNGGIIATENSAFNTGSIANFNPLVHRPPHNFSIGSENNLSYSFRVFDNIFYSDLQGGRIDVSLVRNVTLGRDFKPNLDFRFYNNRIFGGGNQLEIQPLTTLRLYGNKFYNVHGKFFQFLTVPDALPDAVWNENFYYQTSSDASPFTGADFATWKSTSGFDISSTLTYSLPLSPEVQVIRNQYDPQRFYVSILNFSKSPFVALDFSGFGLEAGATYEIIDLQNPFDENTKITGKLGAGQISFPMTNKVALAPKGNMPHAPVHTDETFAVFQVQFSETVTSTSPVFKDTVKISLDYSGLGELKPSEFLVNSQDQALFTYTYSRDPKFTCADLGWKEVTVTAKDAANQTWSSLIKVNVVDELAPYFDAANATYLFDPVVGKVSISIADFDIVDLQENCSPSPTITISRQEITCSDIYQNPNAPVWEFPVVISSTDPSGNKFTKTVKAIIGNVVESKKVTITSLDPLTDNGTSTLRLGNELDYQVLEWTKNGQLIPNQTGREILVNSPGEYKAKIQLATGCIVDSKRFIFEKDLPQEYTNDVNLTLNESGKATLTNEAVFQPGAVPSSLVVLSKKEFDCNDVGTQKVKVTINYTPENSSSIATTEFWINVIVKDSLNPILDTKTPSLAFDKVKGVLQLKPEDFVSSVSDNCGIQSVVLNKSQITCADYDLPIEIIVTATDLSGNQTSKLVTVSASAFESQKISISPAGTQQAYAGEPLKLTLGSEFAYVVEEWLKDGQKIPLQKETSINVTESGTYWARILPNGGCLVESLKVTVTFIDKPYSGVKEVIELPLDANGKATLKPEDVFLSWPLLDPNLDIKLSQSEFSCADIGEKQVSITIKNQSGKTWEEKTLVKIQDKRVPILVPKNYAAEFDVTKGVLELKPENFITSLTDNCQIKEVTINKVNATCEDLGKETTVAIRAVDMVGNVTEATAVLTLIRIENQKVTISGPAQLCQGEKGVLTLTSQASFEVIRWRRNGTEIPGQTGKTLEVSEPGKYHAVIRYTGACLSETAEFEVKVNPLPTGEISVDGNILRAPEGSFTYQWFRNGEKLNGATSRTLTVDLMGEYLVELTSAAGCVAKLKPVTLTISGLGGKQVIQPKDLKMYPNPASELVTLELPDGVLAGNPQILVYSSEGKDVSSAVQITALNSQKVEIRLTSLAKGAYLVWVIGQNQQSYFGKLVVVD